MSTTRAWGFTRDEIAVWPEARDVVGLVWVLRWQDRRDAGRRELHGATLSMPAFATMMFSVRGLR